MNTTHIARAGLCAALALLATACAPSSYAVRNPAPSGQAIAGQAPAGKLGLVDNRAVGDKVFFSGVLPATATAIPLAQLAVTKPASPPVSRAMTRLAARWS